MSLNLFRTQFKIWRARRRFSRKPQCRICNNLNYQGHQKTNLEYNTLDLKLEPAELDRDCPFCRLVILSIESVVNKDSWNARIIIKEDGKEENGWLWLRLEKYRPIIGLLRFPYKKANHVEAEVHRTGESPKDTYDFPLVRFCIYSRDEVCFSFEPSKRLEPEHEIINHRRVQCSPYLRLFHLFAEM